VLAEGALVHTASIGGARNVGQTDVISGRNWKGALKEVHFNGRLRSVSPATHSNLQQRLIAVATSV
jgi:hypothetical protein